MPTTTRITITAVLLSGLVTSTSLAQQPAAAPTEPPPAPSEPPPVANAAPATVTAGAAPAYKGLSLWGILPWSGIGAGGRFMVPLTIRPLLTNTSVRDSF